MADLLNIYNGQITLDAESLSIGDIIALRNIREDILKRERQSLDEVMNNNDADKHYASGNRNMAKMIKQLPQPKR